MIEAAEIFGVVLFIATIFAIESLINSMQNLNDGEREDDCYTEGE